MTVMETTGSEISGAMSSSSIREESLYKNVFQEHIV